MPQLSQILVPVDFSECSGAAVRLAGRFASAFRAELDLLHVVEVPAFVPDESAGSALANLELIELAERQSRAKLDELVADCAAQGFEIRRTSIGRGRPSDVVVDAAKRGNYDLIALATHGRTGFSRVLLGSVAERIVRHAPCPVLSINEPKLPAQTAPKRLLIPVDYSPFSRSALEYARFVAEVQGAEIDVVHVCDRPSYVAGDVVVQDADGQRRSLADMVHENAEREMTEFLRKASGTGAEATLDLPKHRLLSGEPVSTLLAELDKGAYELVVLGTRGRTGLAHLLLGSVAERLVRLSPVPVLTVPSSAPGSST